MDYKPQERYEIIDKVELSETISKHIIHAPLIARKCMPGNFIILMPGEKSERIPVTLADWDREKGYITIIVQAIGKTTIELNSLKKGDFIWEVAGPLGTPVEIKKYGVVVAIAGGVGIAELYPIAKAFKEAGNKVISILGARNSKLLILEKETESISDEIIVATDDGSQGKKGLVTDVLKELYLKEKIDAIFTIGPLIMMKNIALVSKEHNTLTYASLNPIMLDGTGMCGGCRVLIDGKPKFACVDGPMFDAHKVDFETLIKRTNAYKNLEKMSLDKYTHTHNCKIGLH